MERTFFYHQTFRYAVLAVRWGQQAQGYAFPRQRWPDLLARPAWEISI